MFPPCSSFVSTQSLRVLIFHLLFYHFILKMQVKYVKKEKQPELSNSDHFFFFLLIHFAVFLPIIIATQKLCFCQVKRRIARIVLQFALLSWVIAPFCSFRFHDSAISVVDSHNVRNNRSHRLLLLQINLKLLYQLLHPADVV